MAKTLVCTQCGYVGNPQNAIGGNGCIEIILWIFFIIPGLIYSIWRSSSRYKVCPQCKSSTLIPIDSPRAQKIMSESMSKEEIEKTVAESKTAAVKSDNNMKKILIAIAIIVGLMILINLFS